MFNLLVGIIYFTAIYSLWIQYPGLYGVNGLYSLNDDILYKYGTFPNNNEFRLDTIFRNPSIFLYSSFLSVSSECFTESILLCALSLSILFLFGNFRSFIALNLWLIYLGFTIASQTFFNFQWDILLIEFGFLYAVLSLSKSNNLNSCFRFLLFKLMLSAGLVKLQSECPTWQHLTALEYHFATQCIPTPAGW